MKVHASLYIDVSRPGMGGVFLFDKVLPGIPPEGTYIRENQDLYKVVSVILDNWTPVNYIRVDVLRVT